MKYPEISIGELASPQFGAFKIGPFGSSLKKEELTSDGVPVVGIENVLKQQFKRPFRRFITEQKFIELADYEINPGDVLVTTMGTIGKAAVVPNEIEKMIIDSHLFRMRIDQRKVLPEYLCFAINGYSGLLQQLDQKARGAIMDGLNTTILKECVIPLPPLPEQQRIAAILQKADRVRRLRRYARSLSERVLEGVFLEMFGDPALNSHNLPMVELDQLLTESPQNGLYLPQEFYVNNSSTEGVEMVHMADLFYGVVQTGNLRRVKLSGEGLAKYNLLDDDLLIARRSLQIEGAAKPCRLPKLNHPLVFESSIIRIRPNKHIIHPLYLYSYLAHPRTRKYQIMKFVTISTISGINQEGLGNIKVTIPPMEIQKKFISFMVRHEKLNVVHGESERQAEHLFQSLLRRAFLGEL